MTEWWWNHTNLFDTPFALLYFHIPKCGGGSVVYWLLRHNPQFSLKLDYVKSKMFFEMHPDIFGANRWTGPAPAPNWLRTRLAVEYHASTERMYHYIIPRLRALKAKYRAGRGRLVTFTTIVEPLSVVKSFYQMWPPRSNRSLVPLRVWLTTKIASGIITRSLSNGATDCNIQRALMTLRSFDRIIFLETRRGGNLTKFCDFLQWSVCPRFPYKHLTGPVSDLTRLQVAQTPKAFYKPAVLCDQKMLQAAAPLLSHKYISV